VSTTAALRCPACDAPVPPGHDGRGRQPVYCGTDKCKQARARRAAERREAVALLRLVAQMTAYAAEQVGNGLAPADARLAVAELAGELSAAAVRLRRIAARTCRAAHGGAAAVRAGAQRQPDRGQGRDVRKERVPIPRPAVRPSALARARLSARPPARASLPLPDLLSVLPDQGPKTHSFVNGVSCHDRKGQKLGH
jgi:hypothetical protein